MTFDSTRKKNEVTWIILGMWWVQSCKECVLCAKNKQWLVAKPTQVVVNEFSQLWLGPQITWVSFALLSPLSAEYRWPFGTVAEQKVWHVVLWPCLIRFCPSSGICRWYLSCLFIHHLLTSRPLPSHPIPNSMTCFFTLFHISLSQLRTAHICTSVRPSTEAHSTYDYHILKVNWTPSPSSHYLEAAT